MDGGKIGRRQRSAERARFGNDGRGNLAFVEGIAPLSLQHAKCMREIRIAEHPICGRRFTFDQIGSDRIGVLAENFGAVDPVVVNALAQGESLGRKVRRRLQQFLEREGSGAPEQRIPGVDGAWNRDRVDSMERHLFGESALRQIFSPSRATR